MQFCTIDSCAELQWWNFPLILCHLNFRYLLYWSVSQISLLMFFSSEKELFSWTYLLKETPRRTKLLIPSASSKTLIISDTLFELINKEVKCSKISLKFLYNKKLELLETTQEKNRKSHAQDWKIWILYIYWEYLLCPQSNASGVFSEHVLIL